MVDVRNYFEAHELDRPHLLESESRKAEGQGRYSRYDDISPDQVEVLDDHMYFLCAQTVHCYMFKMRGWRKSFMLADDEVRDQDH